jgi:outer membrane protein
MKYFSWFIIVIFALSITTGYAQKSDKGAISIGVVDVETIVKELPEAIAADKLLKDLGQKYRDTLMLFQKEYNDKYEQFDKQKAMMAADQIKKEGENLRAIEVKFQKFQEEKFGVQGELAVRREEFLKPIREKVRTAIEAVAKDEKLNFVFDKGSSALLYSEGKSDITYRVLDKIKRGEK